METPASSQILEGLESTLSFCLSPTLSHLLWGMSSSTDGVGDAVPAGTEVGEEGSRKDRSASVRDTDELSPNCRQGLVLLIPHPRIHVLIKLRRHFCKKRTLVNNYMSKHKKKKGNTDEPNTYSFFPQYR